MRPPPSPGNTTPHRSRCKSRRRSIAHRCPPGEVAVHEVSRRGLRRVPPCGADLAAAAPPDDRTSATASALDSGENCRRCCPIGTPSARHSLADRVSATWGRLTPVSSAAAGGHGYASPRPGPGHVSSPRRSPSYRHSPLADQHQTALTTGKDNPRARGTAPTRRDSRAPGTAKNRSQETTAASTGQLKITKQRG